MLHHTIIPWSPERMRRLILSLICSSDKAANVPKPTSVGITSSQTWVERQQEIKTYQRKRPLGGKPDVGETGRADLRHPALRQIGRQFRQFPHHCPQER